MVYSTSIVEVGPEAETFLAEHMAITFAGNAPEALRPYCWLLAEGVEADGELTVGQGVKIADQSWTITALGSLANKNLAQLGHVTLVFDGADEPQMEGAIHLAGDHETPALAQGATLEFGL